MEVGSSLKMAPTHVQGPWDQLTVSTSKHGGLAR